jgi:hypothetical protein
VSGKSVAVVDPRTNASLRFRAGVDSIFARRLRSRLSTSSFHASPQPLQIMRCDPLDNRWTVNTKGELLAAEKKQSLMTTNLALLAHDYDLRLNVATEIPEPVVDPNATTRAVLPPVNRQNWVVERRKKRTSYVSKDPNLSKWRLDYTEVDIITRSLDGTGAQAAKSKKEFELEFELEREPTLQWLKERDPAKIIELTKSLTDQLTRLVDYCIPYESDVEKETLLVVNDSLFDFQINVMNSYLTHKPAASRSDVERAHARRNPAFEFLGSMPVNLTRQNLNEVQKSDYFVTEKSDGVRYLLYVVQDAQKEPIAVLVDRSRTIFKFRGGDVVGKALGLGVILDGELVYNRSYSENVYLVFDALLWHNVPYIEMMFKERSERIRAEIMPHYTNNLKMLSSAAPAGGGVNLPGNKPPIQLVRKAFVTRKELGVLLNKMRIEEGERVFFDGERGQLKASRHHKSDGFIFQPNARYVFSKHYELLKWKWPELRSVDLLVDIPMEAGSAGHGGGGSGGGGGEWPVYLKCGGPDGTLINLTKRGDTNVGLGNALP